MKITRKGNILEPTPKHRAFFFGITVLCGILAYIAIGILDWKFVGAICGFFFVSLLWLDYSYLFDQIVIQDDHLRTRHAFRIRRIQWDEIASITKEKGSMGVVLKMKSGTIQYAPDLGNSMSTSNVLRAELKKRKASTA